LTDWIGCSKNIANTRDKVGVADKDITSLSASLSYKACCEKDTLLQNLGDDGCTSIKQCEKCQGDCDFDSDCKSGSVCFQRQAYSKPVPGCHNQKNAHNIGDHDYCVDPAALGPLRLDAVDSSRTNMWTKAPTNFAVFPALAGVAMVTLFAFIFIRIE